MNINGISSPSPYSGVVPPTTSVSKSPDNRLGSDDTSKAVEKKDTVSLSYSAIAAAQQDKEDSSVDKVTSKASGFVPGLPDEAYAVPKWMAGYYEDVTYLLRLELPTDPGNIKNSVYASASQQDKEKYSELLQTHVKNLYENSGLGNTAERYHALKNNPVLDEKLHQAFKESISSDPEIMDLMSKLGISLS